MVMPPEATVPPLALVPPTLANPPVWLPAARDAGLAAPLHPAATPVRNRRGATRHADVRIFYLRINGIEAKAAPAIGLADD
jgi:hypothetical protein